MLASARSGSRRLLVNLDRFGKSESELVGLLAHELQHANEVAFAPEVRDAASFQEFFRESIQEHGPRTTDYGLRRGQDFHLRLALPQHPDERGDQIRIEFRAGTFGQVGRRPL